jgi:EpsI family protein
MKAGFEIVLQRERFACHDEINFSQYTGFVPSPGEGDPMPAKKLGLGFLRTRHALVLSAFLAVQAAGFYSLSSGEKVPLKRPLIEMPGQFGDWRLIQEGVIEPEVQEVLRADETLTRQYVSISQNTPADLFVAYFKSQRQGQAPHSPQHCMPGNGWTPVTTDIIPIRIPDRADPIRVNRYVLAKGPEKSVVLYWYQSNRRVIASEYWAKLYLVADAIRYNRTDTALVRVLVPVPENASEEAATKAGINFVQSFFNMLRRYLPA